MTEAGAEELTVNAGNRPGRAEGLWRPAESTYVLPSFVERTSYGIKEMNPYNKLFEERIIFLGVQIDDASANDVMQFVPNDVATYAMGMAASMGQFLLCAGAHGKRYAMPHASILMHQPHGGIGGTATDIRIQAEQILYLKRTLAERIAMHTGQTVEQIEIDSDRDRWFTADEAKDYGLVDRVIRSASEVPSEGPVS